MNFYHDVTIDGQLFVPPMATTTGNQSMLVIGPGGQLQRQAAGTMIFEDAADYYTSSQVDTLLGNYIPLTQKGAINGVATLDAAGKVPSSQLPPIAITDTFVVASQAAMLALTAERGDVAIRTDNGSTYILQNEPASVLANWIQITTPFTGITSVNGYGGPTVNLVTDDIPEDGSPTNRWFTEARARSSISATGTGLSYDPGTGVITGTAAPATGSGNYVQSQTTPFVSAQPTSNFWVSGVGKANNFKAAIYDMGTFDSVRWTVSGDGSTLSLTFPSASATPMTVTSGGIITMNGGSLTLATGNLVMSAGNFSMNWKPSATNYDMTWLNFVDPATLGTTSNHLVTYDPTTSKIKYLPIASLPAPSVPNLQAVTSVDNTTNTTLIQQTANGIITYSAAGSTDNRLTSQNAAASAYKLYSILSGGLQVSSRSGGLAADDGAASLLVNGVFKATAGINTTSGGLSTALGSDGAGQSIVGSFSNNAFAIWTNGSEKMRIMANGNVGIGTTAAQTLLDVRGDIVSSGGPVPTQGRTRISRGTATGHIYGESYDGTNWVAGDLTLNGANVSVSDTFISTNVTAPSGSSLVLTADDEIVVGAASQIFVHPGAGVDMGTVSSPFGTIFLNVGGNIQSNDAFVLTDGTTNAEFGLGGSLIFIRTVSNHPIQFKTNDTERMRISAAGRLLIGTATDDGANILQVTGNVAITGTITASGGGFNSVRSLKKKIKKYTDLAMDVILDSQIKTFEYKNQPGVQFIGIIADEAPKDLMYPDGKVFNTYSAIGILMKGMQELHERISNLENRTHGMVRVGG